MRVLVCGGRDYTDSAAVFAELDALLQQHGTLAVIEGGARGADEFAQLWAKDNLRRGVELITVLALWEVHGRAAGPIRNQQMLDEQKPDLVLAFPGGRGTADMMRRARAAGVEVREIT